MTKLGAVGQREYEQRKKEEDKEAYLQKQHDQKENKENYSKLAKRDVKLRRKNNKKNEKKRIRKKNMKKESSDSGNIINTSHKYFIFRVFIQLQAIFWKSSCSYN